MTKANGYLPYFFRLHRHPQRMQIYSYERTHANHAFISSFEPRSPPRSSSPFKASMPVRKAGRSRWLAEPGSVVLPAGPEFESHQKRISGCWEKKKPIAVLAARLGPLGHGLGFGGFLYPVSWLGFLLLKKNSGACFTPRVEFFFLKPPCLPALKS